MGFEIRIEAGQVDMLRYVIAWTADMLGVRGYMIARTADMLGVQG
ncbi:hypothetical protein [Sporosarcina sp. E16_3]|nr:hypothetical protein [Sporosarcina sp. E16_3]